MRHALILIAAFMATPVLAQTEEADRGYLASFLEDSLSGAGRKVTIAGFSGALSSRAQIERITIADDVGIWLTITGVTLDWSRSALLSGALEVTELSADSIQMDRVPVSRETSLPSPEASGFSLPDLPVTISIDRIAAPEIQLDEAVVGQAVTGSLEAALQLADGTGSATINLLRLGEGPEGQIALDAGYDNATGQLAIDLSATESEGGIVSDLLALPGAPSASLTLQGSGSIGNFAGDLRLATGGEDRLTGVITLTGGGLARYRLQADVGGNLAPLLAPDMVDFFGTDIALLLDATRVESGAVTLDRFDLRARSMTLTGTAQLAADGLPETVAVTGTLASPDGKPVLLPFADIETRIDSGSFSLSLADRGDGGWQGGLSVLGLRRDDLSAEKLELSGSGRIGRTPTGGNIAGTLTLVADGLAPRDPGLAAAVGPTLTGSLQFSTLEEDKVLRLSDLRLEGAGLAVNGNLRIGGLDSGFLTTGKIEVEASDLSRFSPVAGRPLAGRGTLRLDGSLSGLSGFLDGVAKIDSEGLKIGIQPVDDLLAGKSSVMLSILRNETGTTLRALNVNAGPLSATAKGVIASEGSSLTGTVSLGDLAALGPAYGGSAQLQAQFDGTPANGRITLSGTAASLQIDNAQADRLLAGESSLSAGLTLVDGTLQVTEARLANPQLTATVKGELGDSLRNLALEARITNLGLLIPDLQGPLTVVGDTTEDAKGYAVNLALRGPGQIDGRVEGRITQGFGSADLSIKGTGQAGLANIFITPQVIDGPVRYDLRLAGPLRLTSLSGRITLAKGRLSDPSRGFALEGIEAVGDLRGGQARVSASSTLGSGGRLRVEGPIGLTQPFASDLTIGLDGLRLSDPALYEAIIDGSITLRGPLIGGGILSGNLSLTNTEIRVPESGFDTAGTLVNLKHRNESLDVQATRARAGLVNRGGPRRGPPSPGPAFGLDLTVSAPSRIFLRGRGIDAELGGELRLLGTTAAVNPAGGFNLIRGRLDILGKRLVLTQADLTLEGSFVPTLQIAASTESDGVVSTVQIEGPADDPVVNFASIPDLPQEEVLSRLLFDRALDTISPLQAAQLANAVAVLAGRGGEGLVNRLRRGIGLDDLDLATSEDGSTALTAGKYITENVYTEVEIGQGGKSRVNLNLDLRQGITLKAGIDGEGETGIGIFFGRDY